MKHSFSFVALHLLTAAVATSLSQTLSVITNSETWATDLLAANHLQRLQILATVDPCSQPIRCVR